MRAAARRPVFKFDVAHFAHSPDPHTNSYYTAFFLILSHTRALGSGDAKVRTQENDPCVCICESAAGWRWRRERSICLLAFVAACFLSHAIILALAKSTLLLLFFFGQKRKTNANLSPAQQERVNCLLLSPFSRGSLRLIEWAFAGGRTKHVHSLQPRE